MSGSTIDLAALEDRVRAGLVDRYPNKDVALKIGISGDGRLHITIWPTKGGVRYNQWVNVDSEGVVTFPEPDDGMTSITAKPWWVHRTSSVDQALERVLRLVDGAVAEAQKLADERRAALLADRPSLVPTDELLRAARAAWTTSQLQRRLLNACAWVQLDPGFYGSPDVLHGPLDEARRDSAAMGHAATLMRAINNAKARTADQWCAEIGWPATGHAWCAFPSDPAEDERIARQIEGRLLYLPLLGVSVDPTTADGGDGPPRWVFEIVGEFRALPLGGTAGGDGGPELVCGGRFRVLSVIQDGPTTRVQLSYQERLGDAPVANPVLLEVAGQIPGVTGTRMVGPKSLYGDRYKETIYLGLTGDRAVEAIVDSATPCRIETMFCPAGWYEADNLHAGSWEFPPYDGATTVTLPADAQLIRSHVEKRCDPLWLACRKVLVDALVACWLTTGEPWESNGSFDLPAGGYVQWTRVDEPGSDVHIEINEGVFADPMARELVDLLVLLGWNPPDDVFRNCWLRAGRPEYRGHADELSWFFGAADRIIVGVTIAMNVPLAELWVALGGGDDLEQTEPPEYADPRTVTPAKPARAE